MWALALAPVHFAWHFPSSSTLYLMGKRAGGFWAHISGPQSENGPKIGVLQLESGFFAKTFFSIFGRGGVSRPGCVRLRSRVIFLPVKSSPLSTVFLLSTSRCGTLSNSVFVPAFGVEIQSALGGWRPSIQAPLSRQKVARKLRSPTFAPKCGLKVSEGPTLWGLAFQKIKREVLRPPRRHGKARGKKIRKKKMPKKPLFL